MSFELSGQPFMAISAGPLFKFNESIFIFRNACVTRPICYQGRVVPIHAVKRKGDVVERIKTLKREPGNDLQVHGSGELIQTLLKHDLIDAFRLWTFPVLLGTGKRLFAEGTAPAANGQS